jgi:hypothetical protein
MIIKVQNNLADQAFKTFLSNGEDSGTSVLRVKNVNGFSDNWAIQIGKTGEEKSEIKVISTVGTALNTSANITYDHPADTPIYGIKYDQIVFTKSSSGTAGTATPISNGTISITPDETFTQFDDTSGAAADAYRTYFRNSVTTDTSSESDWITSSGFDFYSKAKIRQRIKDKLRIQGLIKNDDIVDDWINEWLENLTNSAIKVNKSYSLGTANVAFGTDGLGTVTETDFKSFKRLWIDYDGVNKYKATSLDISQVDPNETFVDSHPYYSWRGSNVFEIHPPESGGTAQIIYSKRSVLLDDDTDTLPMFLRSYTGSFVNYCVSEAYYSDKQTDLGDRYLSKAENGKQNFISEITPRDQTGVQTIEITNAIYGEDEYYF